MFRWFIIALAALAIAACGGGSESGGGSDPLTLEEYADACADYYDPELYTEGDITWGEYRSKLTPPLEEFKGLNPPAEMRQYHQAIVALGQAVYDFAGVLNQDEILSTSLLGSAPSVVASASIVAEIEQGLPQDIDNLLLEHGCGS